MINCNIKNRDFSLPKNILETNELINQIKLMHKPNSTKEILIVAVTLGEVIAVTLDLIKDKNKLSQLNKYEVVEIKKYNTKLMDHDNSPWSIECQYPYIIIGANNKILMVFNYEENDNNEGINNPNNNLINNSVTYFGNNHNITSVTISDNGCFIGNNSIDKYFKIFDFFTRDLICSIKNPCEEMGWGIKFIPRNLFKIKDYDIGTYDFRQIDNYINAALEVFKLSENNLTNPSPYIEDNHLKISYDDLTDYEKFIKINLIDKYYILSSGTHLAGLFKLDFSFEEKTQKKIVEAIPLGKIELNRIYIRDLYMDKIFLDNLSILNINKINEYTRYEFIYFSKEMNLFFLGSKAGDLHVFEMNIYRDKVNGLVGVEDEPNALISFGEEIVGMKFFESKKIIDIFVLTISGMFYYYKIYIDEYEYIIYN